MSNEIITQNVPKFIADVAAFLEADDNNARISALQKDALDMQVKVKQSELKLQNEYLSKLRDAVKDIPGFWPFTLMRNESVMTACTSKQDLDAFGYLTDVELVQDPEDFRAFELKFTFAENPYFSNTTLVKKYALSPELADSASPKDAAALVDALAEFDPEEDLVSVPTAIDWKSPEKNLIKLQPRELPTLDEDNMDSLTAADLEGDMGSFFHFFTEEEDPMQLGLEIARDILPQTIDYFLGRAGAGGEGSDEGSGFGSEDDEDEEEDGDENAEIDLEEEETKRPTKKAKRS